MHSEAREASEGIVHEHLIPRLGGMFDPPIPDSSTDRKASRISMLKSTDYSHATTITVSCHFHPFVMTHESRGIYEQRIHKRACIAGKHSTAGNFGMRI